MKLKIKTNISTAQNNLKEIVSQVSGSQFSAIVGTNVEYAPIQEYGGVIEWDRKKERPEKDITTVNLPKGGTSERGAFSTKVTFPPRAMVRSSLPTISDYGTSLARSLVNPTDQDFERMAHQLAQRMKTEITMRTPVDTGRLKSSWDDRVVISKGGGVNDV